MTFTKQARILPSEETTELSPKAEDSNKTEIEENLELLTSI